MSTASIESAHPRLTPYLSGHSFHPQGFEGGLLDKLLELLPCLPFEWEYDSRSLVLSSTRKLLGREFLESIKRVMKLLGVDERTDIAYTRLVNPRLTELGILAAARWRGFLG